MRLAIRALFISVAISQIVFLIVCPETRADTRLVKNIRDLESNPLYLTDVNGILFFTADDGLHGRELWKSDGTEAGTVMLIDIHIAPGIGSFPNNLINVNGTLYFTADDGVHGVELWKNDDSAATMPLPESQLVFTQTLSSAPVLNADPTLANPMGLGAVATGGDTVDIGIGTIGFSGPAVP